MWQHIEHPGEVWKHGNFDAWLADKLNSMGATRLHVLYYNSDNYTFEAVAYVPMSAPEPPQAPIVQKPTEYPGVQYLDDTDGNQGS